MYVAVAACEYVAAGDQEPFYQRQPNKMWWRTRSTRMQRMTLLALISVYALTSADGEITHGELSAAKRNTFQGVSLLHQNCGSRSLNFHNAQRVISCLMGTDRSGGMFLDTRQANLISEPTNSSSSPLYCIGPAGQGSVDPLGEDKLVYAPSMQSHHNTSMHELGGIHYDVTLRFTFCHHCSYSIECCKKPWGHKHQAQTNQPYLSR